MLLSFGSDDTVACVLFIYLFVHKVYFGLLIYICSLDGKFGLQKRAQRASPQSGALKSQTGHTAHSTDDSRARQKCVEKCARVSREACRRVHHILKSEKLYFLFNLTLARGVPACCSVNTVQARVKRATLAPVAALPTGAHPAIPAITAPRISHEPAAAAPRAL